MMHDHTNIKLNRYSCQASMEPEFSGQILDKYSYINSHENPSSGRPVCTMRTDLRTDRHDESSSHFVANLRTRLIFVPSQHKKLHVSRSLVSELISYVPHSQRNIHCGKSSITVPLCVTLPPHLKIKLTTIPFHGCVLQLTVSASTCRSSL